MIIIGNISFLFCFSSVSLRNKPVFSLILVIYCSFLLGSTINACYQGMLIIIWILIYVGGIIVIFTYCVFFSHERKRFRILHFEENYVTIFLSYFFTWFLYSISLKESWFYWAKQDKYNDNFIFKKSAVEIYNMGEKRMFLLGELGLIILIIIFLLILLILLFTTIIIKDLIIKQNLI